MAGLWKVKQWVSCPSSSLPDIYYKAQTVRQFRAYVTPSSCHVRTDQIRYEICSINEVPQAIKIKWVVVKRVTCSLFIPLSPPPKKSPSTTILMSSLYTTYLLTPWCRVLLEKLTGLQLAKKFPVFYGTRRFITALTSVRHLSLSWASPIQSPYPHPTFWRSILILSTHLRLGLPSVLFPSGFPTKTLYAPLSSPIRTTCPAHLILLDHIKGTRDKFEIPI